MLLAVYLILFIISPMKMQPTDLTVAGCGVSMMLPGTNAPAQDGSSCFRSLIITFQLSTADTTSHYWWILRVRPYVLLFVAFRIPPSVRKTGFYSFRQAYQWFCPENRKELPHTDIFTVISSFLD